jgi:dCTP deaminase
VGFWSGQTLKHRAETEKLIDPFDEKRIDCSAYTLRVGYEAFVTRDRTDQVAAHSRGQTPGHLLASREETFSIPSGQFAFLIAYEKVRIPNDAIGFISLKSARKWRGLVNVSGFHVDPGWSGKLLFSVFNAGPNTLVIHPEEPLFLLFFCSLDSVAAPEFHYKGESKFARIPTTFMEAMSAPVPTVYKLNEAVNVLQESVRSSETRSTVALYAAFTLGGTALAASLTLLARMFGLI